MEWGWNQPRQIAASAFLTSVLAVIAFSWELYAVTQVDEKQSSVVSAKELIPPSIVVGFVGGFVRHDALAHSEVQLADRLRKDYPSGVDVRIFANHVGQARQYIRKILDTDHNDQLSAEEKHQARIVLYGHSWGASETIETARSLEKDGIPVMLTVQVDSVRKPGEDDRLIPTNVAEAINFYQLDGLLHGRSRILATDPRRTTILGNFQSEYKTAQINCDGYPWYARLFTKPHIEIESDPKVWSRIDTLIRSRLDPAH